MKTIKLLILQNETKKDIAHWVSACEKIKEKIQYSIVDITRYDWLKQVLNSAPDIILTKPGGLTSHYRQLYDERLMILVKELGFKCFPTLDEVLIYENKRYFSYWLEAHHVPHPETNVFYSKDEAIDYINKSGFPLVGKVNIGASGSGVKILHNFQETADYIQRTFTGKGADKRTGPNYKMGGIFRRGLRYIFHPGEIAGKIKIFQAKAADVQRDFVILQQYISHDFEWRVVRIGESFFAHKKLITGEKASGSLLKNYDNPPLRIFDFVKEITDNFGFYSQAVDLFETNEGYLVNEMQCIFGQSDPYQMQVDGKTGRYLNIDGNWVFEEGDFNSNESYDLRLEMAIVLYNSHKL